VLAPVPLVFDGALDAVAHGYTPAVERMGGSRSLDASKRLILDVLSGDVTEDNSPGVFEEDMLYFAVRMVEQRDAAWLRDALGRAAWRRERIDHILANLSPAGRIALRGFFDPPLVVAAAGSDSTSPGSQPPRELDAYPAGATALSLRDPKGRWSFEVPSGPGMWALIGRRPPADFVIPILAVSTRHTRVFFAQGGWFAEDAGSTSGTRLNGRSIHVAERLKDGDRLEIGGEGLDVRTLDRGGR